MPSLASSVDSGGSPDRLDGRVGDGQDLAVVVAELLHRPEPRVQVVEHGDAIVALELPERRLHGHFRGLIKERLGEDMREYVDLPH